MDKMIFEIFIFELKADRNMERGIDIETGKESRRRSEKINNRKRQRVEKAE